MRRGNGDGSVFKLSGKRRKPWAVRVTVGFTDEGKQKYKYIGYYENKSQAKNALMKYLTDPHDINDEKMTLKMVFDAMIEKSKLADSTALQYTSRFRKLELLHNKEIDKVTLAELEEIISKETPAVQSGIKKALSKCYLYAMKHKYVQENVVQFLETESVTVQRQKVPFSVEEITALWEKLGTQENDDVAIILLYTGMRIGELLDMEIRNVNLDEKYMFVEKSKTKAGIRKVPIHDKILPIIKKRYEQGNKYLITQNGHKIRYMTYLRHFWKNENHTIHETRHTFVTHMNKCGIDDLTIKRIVGHANKDVTENYTHRTQLEMLNAINVLQYA